MATPGLRRQSTLPVDTESGDSPRKILKAKRRLAGGSKGTATEASLQSRTSSLIKPSLSTKKSSTKSLLKKPSAQPYSVTTTPSLTKKSSITKEMSDISTAVISLDSGSHIGKTGIITDDDISPDVEVIEIYTASTFSETGKAVVASLKRAMSGTDSISPKISRKESSRQAASMLVPLPPGGLVEIAFSFDTTGSMSSALNEVKGRIKDIVQKLQSDVPGIRIAIFAHGDYCDVDKYIVKWIDFGATLPELHDFVNSCENTSGGDGPECYELVLRRAHEVLSWTPGSKRSLVIIGDDIPHEPGYRYKEFTNDINWRDECSKLKDMGVRVYGVAVKADQNAQKFYQEIATRTEGLMITLDKFNLIFDLMMSICYREGGEDLFKAYQDELKQKYGVAEIFSDASKSAVTFGTTTGGGLFGTTTGGVLISTGAGIFSAIGLFGAATGTVKARKHGVPKKKGPTKTTKTPAKKKIHKNKAQNLQKSKPNTTLREMVNDKKFRSTKPLNRLLWSNWKLAMCNDGSNKHAKWAKWLKGYYIKQIFTTNTGKSAVYELGLKPQLKKKTYVVGFTVLDKLSPDKWCTQLIRRADVKEKLRHVVSQKASVYIRRAVFRTKNKKFMEKVRKYLVQSNYAFGTSKKNSRNVKVKGGILTV